jgi:inorganic phosphate transporter, PiT family
MRILFTSGIVDTTPTPPFAVAVLTGTAGWVGLATAARLPVSTTHALVGAPIGAGLLAAPHAVRWPALAGKVAIPLPGSAVVAYLGSALLGALLRRRAGRPPEGLRAVVPPLPGITGLGERTLTGVHWASAGLVGAARGLNDTPKLAAVAGFALLPAGVPATAVVVGVAVMMLAGALLAGRRLSRRMGEDVIRLDQQDGLRANLTTSLLVGAGAGYGLPMSTTHVATGAIAGIVGARTSRLNLATLCDFALAWTLTPAVGGLLAAITYLLVHG